MSSALADRDVFESLAPPPAAVAEIKGEQYANICRELERSVLTYLREEATIEQRRCFLLRPQTSWNSMEKFIENELAVQASKRLAFDWHDPGIDLVAVWKIGRFRSGRIAVAMSSEPIDGQPAVGYFKLK